jgi:hypothetical protein
MKKPLIVTALLFAVLPFTFDGVTPTVSKAHAVLGRPLTPLSVAGVHRRAVRRTFGVGANLGYRGVYHRNFGPYAYHRVHPIARAAVVGGALATGVGWGGGWGGWGWQQPWRPGLYAYAGGAPSWGGGWGGWGWQRPWRAGLYDYAGGAPGWGGLGWRGGWGGWGGGWGWRRGWW